MFGIIIKDHRGTQETIRRRDGDQAKRLFGWGNGCEFKAESRLIGAAAALDGQTE